MAEQFIIEDGVLKKYLDNEDVVTIPDGIREIGTKAFEKKDKLQMLIISEGVEAIGPYAFYQCTNLQAIKFPKYLKKIGFSAFAGCELLGTVSLPEGLETIGESAFIGTGLVDVKVPSTVKRVPGSAFPRKPVEIKEESVKIPAPEPKEEPVKVVGKQSVISAVEEKGTERNTQDKRNQESEPAETTGKPQQESVEDQQQLIQAQDVSDTAAESIYQNAKALKEKAYSAATFQEAANLFRKIPDYKDAGALALVCEKKSREYGIIHEQQKPEKTGNVTGCLGVIVVSVIKYWWVILILILVLKGCDSSDSRPQGNYNHGDKYYYNNDHNADGFINDSEFQDAVGDWMTDHGY